MKAGIVILDNASKPESSRKWLEGYLKSIGVEVSSYLLKLGDIDYLKEIFSQNDALIIVGAAGEKSVVGKVAELLNLGVEVNGEALEMIRSYYSDQIDLPEHVEEKAMMPEFSFVVPNERGPVPGFVAFSLTNDKFIAATPARFEEAVECFETGIQDFFRAKTGKKYSVTFTLYLDGSIEEAENMVRKLETQAENTFIRLDARFLGREGVPIVLTVYAATPEELSDTMAKLEDYSHRLAQEMGKKLIEKTQPEQEEEF
ncbi:MAG: hypothetical protein ABWK01_09390 [Infirmifilum sp.]